MLQRDKALEMYSEGRDLLSAKLIERAQLFRALDKLVKTPQPIGPMTVDIDWHQAIMRSDVLTEIEREIYWLVDAINRIRSNVVSHLWTAQIPTWIRVDG